MDQWLGLGIFLLGVGIGALLTRIADIVLRQTILSAAEGKTTNLSSEDFKMLYLQSGGKVRSRREQLRSSCEQIVGGKQCS